MVDQLRRNNHDPRTSVSISYIGMVGEAGIECLFDQYFNVQVGFNLLYRYGSIIAVPVSPLHHFTFQSLI